MKVVSGDTEQRGNEPRSLTEFLAPLLSLTALDSKLLGGFESNGHKYSIPRFDFKGPNSSDPIRIGIFGAIHGDEPAGPFALAEFLRRLVAQPDLAENFQLQIYPVCNPTGFEDNTRKSRRGRDLNREFWR